MQIELRERREEHVRIYHEKTLDAEVRRFLPQKIKTLEETLKEYRASLLPGSTSYGRTIYADGEYVGDIWAYYLQRERPNAMVSYCVFEKACWGKGLATEALRLLLEEIAGKFGVESVGAFTFLDNAASIRVLEKNGFAETERLDDNGVKSAYFERSL